MVTHPGVYCLRSNVTDWDEATLWRTYITLTDIEAVFRSLKSELGLRPIYHQKPIRAEGHLLSAEETRALLDGIDVAMLAGLRDRALLGVLVYSFARVSATVSMQVADYYTQGPRSFFRLHEKGGRYNVVPAHHTAQAYVDAYIEAADIAEDRRGPLFRPCPPGRNDTLFDQPMTRATALKMIKRRAASAGLPREICAHSFRGTGITVYLRNDGDLEVAARIAGHESTRTTQLYNRLPEEISLDEIERIHI